MNERKRIVRSDTTRKNHQEKLKAALAKKPTAAFLNSSMLNPLQQKQIANIPEAKQKFLNERLVKNSKNRKRFQNRPLTISASVTVSLMDAPTYSGDSYEYPTPPWFRNEKPVDVSVIVPLYKSDKVIIDLIRSFPLKNRLTWEIIFVDDCCPNKSKETVLQAWATRKGEIITPIGKIVFNAVNKGYGQACNAGVDFALGKHLIFLNADTQLTPNWMEPMIELFNDPKVGIVGNMHLKEGGGHDGTIDSAGSEWKWPDMSFVHIARHCYQKQSISTPFKINNCPKELLEVGEREMVTGCCFAMPKKLFNYIGGFNPNYRIGYWEDSEICMNVRELGYKILFQPNSIIHHKLGHTSSGNHQYFSHNKHYFMNKWVNSHRLDDLLLSESRGSKNDLKTIVVKRTSAHGDALIAAGVCAGLRKKYPNAKIIFSTMFPEIIGENPNIDEFVNLNKLNELTFDVFYNLDLCYEWRPGVNILTAYAEAVGVKTEDCKVFLNPQPPKEITLPDEYIVIHPGKTNWVGRDWPHDNFVKLSQRLLDAGHKVVCIGKYSEQEIPCTVDARSKTSIAETAFVIKYAKAFVGIDSLPMHIAQAVDAPGVAFFGSVNPELRIYTPNMKGVVAKNLACLGCHHRKIAPSTVTNVCETGTHACLFEVTVDQMWDKLMEVLS